MLRGIELYALGVDQRVCCGQASVRIEKEKQKIEAFAKQAAVQLERREAKKQRKAPPMPTHADPRTHACACALLP